MRFCFGLHGPTRLEVVCGGAAVVGTFIGTFSGCFVFRFLLGKMSIWVRTRGFVDFRKLSRRCRVPYVVRTSSLRLWVRFRDVIFTFVLTFSGPGRFRYVSPRFFGTGSGLSRCVFLTLSGWARFRDISGFVAAQTVFGTWYVFRYVSGRCRNVFNVFRYFFWLLSLSVRFRGAAVTFSVRFGDVLAFSTFWGLFRDFFSLRLLIMYFDALSGRCPWGTARSTAARMLLLKFCWLVYGCSKAGASQRWGRGFPPVLQ